MSSRKRSTIPFGRPMSTNYELYDFAKRKRIKLNDIIYKDKLKGTPVNGGYILNLEDEKDKGKGSHWLSIWIDLQRKKLWFFDSFGIKPPEIVEQFAKKNNLTLHYSTKQIQDVNRGYCGQYVISWLKHIQKDPTIKGYKKFLDQFYDLGNNQYGPGYAIYFASQNEKTLKKIW